MENLVTETQTLEKERKPSGKRRGRFKVPKFAYPIRALWDQAREEERTLAHETSIEIMEYWLGRKSKVEVSKILKIPPIRVWQLSQAAISGMLAGLLVQPKMKEVEMNPKEDPKILLKKIAELEEVIRTQDSLIRIMRQMPGIAKVKKDGAVRAEVPTADRRMDEKESKPRGDKSSLRKPRRKREDAE